MKIIALLFTMFAFLHCNSETPSEADPENEIETDYSELLDDFHSLAGVELNSSTEDLFPILESVGLVDIVALGESVHTSGGFSQIKNRIVKFLIEEHGFRSVALETPWKEAELVSEYVKTCDGLPNEALRGVFWVWANDALSDLVVWMCEWNQKNPSDQVHFWGFDIQQPWSDFALLRETLGELRISDLNSALESIATCDGTSYVSGADYYGNGGLEQTLTENNFESCLIGIQTIRSLLENQPDSGSSDQIAWALIALKGIEAWQGQKFHLSKDVTQSIEARDSGMAYVFDKYRELKYPGSKTVIWAHNTHIAKRLDEVDGFFAGGKGMGNHLSEAHGANYVAYGLIGYEVHINWPGIGFGVVESFQQKGNLEEILHSIGSGDVFIDFSRLRASISLFGDDIEHTLGSGDVMLPKIQFDGLIYLKESPPMNSIF